MRFARGARSIEECVQIRYNVTASLPVFAAPYYERTRMLFTLFSLRACTIHVRKKVNGRGEKVSRRIRIYLYTNCILSVYIYFAMRDTLQRRLNAPSALTIRGRREREGDGKRDTIDSNTLLRLCARHFPPSFAIGESTGSPREHLFRFLGPLGDRTRLSRADTRHLVSLLSRARALLLS